MSDLFVFEASGENLPVPPKRPGRKVLIVDDDATTVALLRRALEAEEYLVVGLAADGATAVELARDVEPDLILMDYTMPGTDGAEATRQIMYQRSVPIVMLTGHSDPAHINQALEAGVCTYLVKPINRALLLPAIQTAFDVYKMSHY